MFFFLESGRLMSFFFLASSSFFFLLFLFFVPCKQVERLTERRMEMQRKLETIKFSGAGSTDFNHDMIDKLSRLVLILYFTIIYYYFISY